jgi:hypothetical protein
LQLLLEFVDLCFGEGLHGEQAVDEEAVAARRRHTPGRGVRAGDEAHFFQVGHDVAHGGRRKLQPGVFRQGATHNCFA